MQWEDILNKVRITLNRSSGRALPVQLDISHRMKVEVVGKKWPLWEAPIVMSELSCVIDAKLKKSQIVHHYSGLTTGSAKLRHRIWNAK